MARIGSVVGGRFKIVDTIGKGGMGVVWLASDRNLGKYWAIKEIKVNEGSTDRDKRIRIERLYSEADMMKRLDHPAMPRIVDLITEASTLYVVMDYVNGTSLDRELKRNKGPFDQELVISWAIQLCDVLGYLHGQNPPVVYRDMKPSNVMLCSDGLVKLIDFGIAREYKPGQSSDTQVLGTPDYAAPEQLASDQQSDARVDIYALGKTMYRLVTGCRSKELAAMKPVREVNPQLSQGLENIILKCTQTDPDRRYQTCDELRYDLEHYEEITDEHVARQKAKVRRFWGFVGASAACLALGACLFLGGNAVSASESGALGDAARDNVKAALTAESSGDAAAESAAWASALAGYRSAVQQDERTALESIASGALAEWKSDDVSSTGETGLSADGFSQMASLLRSVEPTDAANRGRYAALCFDFAQAWYWHAPDSVTERKRAKDVYEWYERAAEYGISNASDYLSDAALNLDGYAEEGLTLEEGGLTNDEAKASLVYAALTSYYAVSDEGVNNIYKKYWGNLNQVVDHLDDLAFESPTIKALACSLSLSAIRDTDVLRSMRGSIVESAGGDVAAAKSQVENLLDKVTAELEGLSDEGSVDDYVKKAAALAGEDKAQARQSVEAVFATLYGTSAADSTGGGVS